jgi:large exoprotein involved in heme utilization and adhesion
VAAGVAKFNRGGDNLLIRQDSQKLIIDWKEFSISNGELTRFLQPGSNSAALNRVSGGIRPQSTALFKRTAKFTS